MGGRGGGFVFVIAERFGMRDLTAVMLHELGQPALAYGLLLAANGALIVAFEAPIAVLLRHRAAVCVIAVGSAGSALNPAPD